MLIINSQIMRLHVSVWWSAGGICRLSWMWTVKHFSVPLRSNPIKSTHARRLLLKSCSSPSVLRCNGIILLNNWAYPSCHWARDRVQPARVASPSQGQHRDKQHGTLIPTPRVTLESQITPMYVFGWWEEAGIETMEAQGKHGHSTQNGPSWLNSNFM